MASDENFGERLADRITTGMGSWKFIIAQALFTVLWIVLNGVAWCAHWDPQPWIMLNLVYSFQAGFTGPILLLAQNRQTAKDSAHISEDLATDAASFNMLKSIVVHLNIPQTEE